MRTAVVTGANRGIGRAVAEALDAQGFRVVLVGRDGTGLEAARVSLRGPAEVVIGDLGTLSGVRAVARELLERVPTLDVLVHNAGLWPSRMERNEDGLERAFAVNHVAPFVLNHLLEERLRESRTRVIGVSAGLHVKGRVDLERTPTGDEFHPILTYATTKLCNLLMMPLWAERWSSGPTIASVHPGVIRTGLGDRPGMLGAVLSLAKRLWASPEEGARNVVRLVRTSRAATHDEPGTGRYYHLDREAPFTRDDRPLARALWDRTAKIAGLDGQAAPR